MAKPGTIPVTTILSRDLRKWLEAEARKEDKKLSPYIRKVLETHRANLGDDETRARHQALRDATPKPERTP